MRQIRLALIPLFTATVASAQDPLDRGLALLEADKAAEAVAILVPAAKANPRSARATFLAGRALVEEGETLRRAGNQAGATKKFEQATDWLEKATELAPQDAVAWRWLGNTYGRRAQSANKFQQARLAGKVKSAFETAVRLDPTDVESRESLIQFYLQAPGFMGGSVDKALVEAKAIAKYDKLRGHNQAALVYLRQRDTAKVIEEYRAAARAFPDSIPPQVSLVAGLGNVGRHADLWTEIDRMEARFPDEPRVIFQVGRAAAVSGQQLDRGAKSLRRYLTLTPRPVDIPLTAAHYRLGMILAKQGDKAGARAEYEATLRLDKNHRDAKAALEALK